MVDIDLSGAFEVIGGSVRLEKAHKTHVVYWGDEDLGDQSNLHRWRASWSNDSDGYPDEIVLQAHPVIKLTPKGAWVAEYASRQATKKPWEDGAPAYEWDTFGSKGRFVMNGSGSSWAKMTREEAVASLAYRMVNWANRMVHDYRRLVSAVDTMERIRPDFQQKITNARDAIKAIKREQTTYIGGAN